jgi:hypothetical protein
MFHGIFFQKHLTQAEDDAAAPLYFQDDKRVKWEREVRSLSDTEIAFWSHIISLKKNFFFQKLLFPVSKKILSIFLQSADAVKVKKFFLTIFKIGSLFILDVLSGFCRRIWRSAVK